MLCTVAVLIHLNITGIMYIGLTPLHDFFLDNESMHNYFLLTFSFACIFFLKSPHPSQKI